MSDEGAETYSTESDSLKLAGHLLGHLLTSWILISKAVALTLVKILDWIVLVKLTRCEVNSALNAL